MLGDDKRKMTGTEYDAYTQPADVKKGRMEVPYTFTYDAVPPDFSPQEAAHEAGARRHTVRTVFAAVLLVLAAALVVTAAVFFIRFDMRFRGEDGIFSIEFIPRGKEAGTTEEEPDSQLPVANETPAQPGATDNAVTWDGTTLVISGPPQSQIGETVEEGQLSYQQIYAKCAPAVVAITAVADSGMSTGTGVIMSADGYIVTCSHLLSTGAEIGVTLENGESYLAILIGQDKQTDLAVLKIDAGELPYAEFGDSDALEVGETVLAIGNPLGQNLTMTDGIIPAIDRNVEHNGYTMTLLQTNAAINEGNSGGPLINMYGQVVGITNMKMMSYYSTVEGIGFAIPVSGAKDIVDALLQYGYIAGRPAIGIQTSNIPTAAAAYYKLPAGALVEKVYPDTDAYAKGLQRGDIITAVDGREISSQSALNLIAFGYKAGDEATLTVYRSGVYLEFTITLCDLALLDD